MTMEAIKFFFLLSFTSSLVPRSISHFIGCKSTFSLGSWPFAHVWRHDRVSSLNITSPFFLYVDSSFHLSRVLHFLLHLLHQSPRTLVSLFFLSFLLSLSFHPSIVSAVKEPSKSERSQVFGVAGSTLRFSLPSWIGPLVNWAALHLHRINLFSPLHSVAPSLQSPLYTHFTHFHSF